ncbi:maltose alpha-D-glucosyltransferase [Balamuthia mandrillaris]
MLEPRFEDGQADGVIEKEKHHHEYSGQLIDYFTHEELSFPSETKLWYKEAVFYEVYVRAFCDSTGSGHGDFVGLTSKLDYLHYLGVDCLWLLPMYPSPLVDDGYDVADYVGIHPDYGTLEDFKTFVNAVHERSMRIIVDFVPNHCSYQHRWFQEARKDRNSPYRDYFVWSDTDKKYADARIIFIDTEPSNWTWDEVAGQYYWHRFYKEQPDLNFDNPKVREEMMRIVKFWLDVGVDGFRCDAVPYLFEEEGTNCENLPRTHVFLKELRKFVDDNYTGRVLLAEACQMPDQVRKYFGDGDGDEFHMGFHFPVMPRIFMSLRKEDCTSLKEILEETPEIPPKCQWMTFLRNHDELTLEMVTPEERQYMWEVYAPEKRMRLNLGIRRRLAPLLNNDRRQIELAFSLLLTLPGSPIIYYGDEIGMGDNIQLPDRNGVRTPMQWNTKPHGGFSSPSTTKLYAPVINDAVYGYQRVNVDSQQHDPSSLFHAIRMMLQVRRKHPSFGSGTLTWLTNELTSVAAYVRSTDVDKMLIVSNVSGKEISATVEVPEECLTNPAEEQLELREELTGVKYKGTSSGTLQVSLQPYQFLWLDLSTPPNQYREE